MYGIDSFCSGVDEAFRREIFYPPIHSTYESILLIFHMIIESELAAMILILLAFAGLLPVVHGQGPFANAATCASTNRSCVNGEATCVGERCVCQSPFQWGHGDFRCYKKDWVGCELKNDPTLIGFNKELANFPYPCRYLVADSFTEIKSPTNDTKYGYCLTQVFAFNLKDKGKFYVAGFDVGLSIAYNSLGPVFDYSFRQTAVANNNVNTAQSLGYMDQSRPFVPGSSDNIMQYMDNLHDVYVYNEYDSANNRYHFRIDGCGVDISFVPYDTGLRRAQKQVPGLSVRIANRNSELD
ncbi:hypothetical protein PoB_003822100 [Plakobranchus ocellatus]|uniref:Uncharacterized protein n=1 Tax=Plakobranchus ocellatus TaxID=259542 RepID=A0AAV4AYW4_9GAST|nr:hypothetical protein PoB_003822100 [Plakobranchus ocellatus]